MSSDDDESTDARVTIKLTQSKKDEWTDYIDESPFHGSLTDLVKLSVEKERTGALDREAVEDLDLNLDANELSDAIETGLNEVTKQLEEFDDRIAAVEAAVKTGDDIDKLARDIYEELLVVESAEKMRQLEETMVPIPEQEDMLKITGTVEAWAAYFDVSEGDARRALGRAIEYPDVDYVTMEDTGQRRYFRYAEDTSREVS